MYSPWLYFAGMILLLLIAASPALALADTPPSGGHNRLRSLDGLRGFLALAVVFHHGAIYHRYLIDGVWQPSPSHFYEMLGPVGVSLFFMITGFLFWSRLIRQSGRPDWTRLYIDRLFRIGPLYLAAIAAMLAGVVIEGGTALHDSPGGLVRDLVPWLALGLLDGPNIAGFPDTYLLLAGVTWTLKSEWLFYLSLPVLALAARRTLTHLPAVALLLAAALIRLAVHPGVPGPPHRLQLIALFLTGMVCASLHASGLAKRLPNYWSSTGLVALLVSVVTTQDGYTAGCTAMLGVVFYLIVSGCTVFGLLESRPAIRLGDISYGIYLLQGLALAVVLRPQPLHAVALGSPLGHWALVLLSMIVLLAIATLAHVRIERPGIALGKRLAARLASGRQWLASLPR